MPAAPLVVVLGPPELVPPVLTLPPLVVPPLVVLPVEGVLVEGLLPPVVLLLPLELTLVPGEPPVPAVVEGVAGPEGAAPPPSPESDPQAVMQRVATESTTCGAVESVSLRRVMGG